MIKKLAALLYWKFFRLYGKHILNIRKRISIALTLTAYAKTFSLFPENSLRQNSNIANRVVRGLIGFAVDSDIVVDVEQCEVLEKSLLVDDFFKEKTCTFYLLTKFYYSFGKLSSRFEDEIEVADKKAKKFNGGCKDLCFESVGLINKSVKSDIKRLKGEVKELNTERVEAEKERRIKPISVNGSHFMFLASVVSTLFFVGGFVYNKVFFLSLGLSVGDFFTIADYVSSSVDVLFMVFMSALIGFIYMLWGYSDGVGDRVHSELFEVERKGIDYTYPFMIMLASLVGVFSSYINGRVDYYLVGYVTLFVLFYYMPKWHVWKYIKNSTAVASVIISVSVFSVHLCSTALKKAEDIKEHRHISMYSVVYKDEYKRFADDVYFMSNSNYVFLWDETIRKVNIVPRNGVEYFYVNE